MHAFKPCLGVFLTLLLGLLKGELAIAVRSPLSAKKRGDQKYMPCFLVGRDSN